MHNDENKFILVAARLYFLLRYYIYHINILVVIRSCKTIVFRLILRNYIFIRLSYKAKTKKAKTLKVNKNCHKFIQEHLQEQQIKNKTSAICVKIKCKKGFFRTIFQLS